MAHDLVIHEEETVNDMPDGGIIRDGRLPGPHAVSGAGRVLRAA